MRKGAAVIARESTVQANGANAQPSSPGKPAASAGMPVMPVKPLLSSGDKPEIVIRVAPGSFPELMAYNNLKFELQDADKSWNPKDADEEWSDIKLDRADKQGLYAITFSNKNKTVTYKARPVLEGDDYTTAIKIFETKQKEYRQALGNRLKKDSLQKDRQLRLAEQDKQEELKLIAENERIRKINELIGARNKIIEARNKEIEAQNKLVTATSKAREITYGFEVDGFGIWNCDRALSVKTIKLNARFTDSDGREIKLYNSTTVMKNINGVMANEDGRVLIYPGTDNMIWGIADGCFAYFSYEAFRHLQMGPDTKEQTFKMTVLPQERCNYNDIRAIINRLP